MKAIVAHTTGLGACHRSCSSTVASTVITSVVITVIQNTMASVGAVMRVRRSCCVPNAHTAADTSMPAAAQGRPVMRPSSCHSSSATPSAAAATPSSCRDDRRWPNSATPHRAENTGIV